MTRSPARARTAVRLLLAVLLATACQLLPATSATAVITQGIEGIVSGPDGPIDGAEVFVTRTDGLAFYHNYAYTGADGAYAFDVPEGAYVLRFRAAGYTTEYWDGALKESEATPVVVGSGQATTANAALSAPGAVTGRIMNASGEPLPDAAASAYLDGQKVYSTVSQADGAFSLGLPSGRTYTIEISRWGYTSQSAGAVTISPGVAVPVGEFALAAKAVATTSPRIDGSGMLGETMRAMPGTWNPSDAQFSYQWTRDDQAIPGATGRDYNVSSDDVGTTLGVLVTGGAQGYESTQYPATNPKFIDGQQTATPIANTKPPVIMGTPEVDGSLQVTGAEWNPVWVRTVAYQWYRGEEPIAGATEQHYRPTAVDLGHVLRARVTVTQGYYAPGTAWTEPTAPVAKAQMLADEYPVITGTARVGSVLSRTLGTWWTPPTSSSTQWFRTTSSGRVAISGATGATYTPTAADHGARISVLVTAHRDGYHPGSAHSAATGVVAPAPFANTALPTISGRAQVGAVLTSTAGAWSPAGTYTRQWIANGVPIAGATGASYTVKAAEVGKRIAVRVTATRTGYATKMVQSAATAAVVKGSFVVTRAGSAPTGRLRVGYRLTAVPPTASPAPAAIRYQWLRNGVAIKGATYRTYRLTRYDRRKRIGVRITLVRTGYNSLVRTYTRSRYVG